MEQFAIVLCGKDGSVTRVFGPFVSLIHARQVEEKVRDVYPKDAVTLASMTKTPPRETLVPQR